VDLSPSARSREFAERLTALLEERVLPAEAVFEEQLREAGDPHAHAPVMEEPKEEARRRGLWNLFHPDPAYGPGLSYVESAPLAEITGAARSGPRP
jgi:acyl-CoA dehydrogenase